MALTLPPHPQTNDRILEESCPWEALGGKGRIGGVEKLPPSEQYSK